MEKQNNNMAVIVLLLVIIAMLATLCVLFVTATLEGYKVDSYKTDNNKIIITGRECSLQCANTESEYPRATFEIEYNNNSFSSPKLVEKFTS